MFSVVLTSNDIITSADILALILLFTSDCSSFTFVIKQRFHSRTVLQYLSSKKFCFQYYMVVSIDNLYFLAARANLFCSHDSGGIKIEVDAGLLVFRAVTEPQI